MGRRLGNPVGHGGTAVDDGPSAIMHHGEAGTRITPAEVWEAKNPWLLERFELRVDSCGPGRHRGGLGVDMFFRMLEDCWLTCGVERTQNAPWGLQGGGEAMPNRAGRPPSRRQPRRGRQGDRPADRRRVRCSSSRPEAAAATGRRPSATSRRSRPTSAMDTSPRRTRSATIRSFEKGKDEIGDVADRDPRIGGPDRARQRRRAFPDRQRRGRPVRRLLGPGRRRRRWASAEHTRVENSRLFPIVGEHIYTNRRDPMLLFESDTSVGIHDMLVAACDPPRFRNLGVEGWHPSCEENFFKVAARSAGATRSSLSRSAGSPTSRSTTTVASTGRRRRASRATRSTLSAEIDCDVIVCSCAQDIVPINHLNPTPLALELLGPG